MNWPPSKAFDRRWPEFPRLCAAAIFILVQPAVVTAQTDTPTTPTLAAPHKVILFERAPGSLIPHWENGYLVSRKAEVWHPDEWAVRLYDAAGIQQREARIWFPNSVRVGIHGASATSDGRIVIAGGANKRDGTRAFFVAITGTDGQLAQVIRTNPYLPGHVCVAPDGSIWTFGADLDSGPDSQSPTLRQFDLAKGQIAALLPRSTFSTRKSPADSLGQGRSVAFACSADRVSIYPEAAGEFIEVLFTTQTVYRWKMDRFGSDLPLYGSRMAVTPSGNVYAKLGPILNVGAPRGLFRLERMSETGEARWLPVLGHQYPNWDASLIEWIYGTDGDTLVYRKKGELYVAEWARWVKE